MNDRLLTLTAVITVTLALALFIMAPTMMGDFELFSQFLAELVQWEEHFRGR